MPSAYFVSDLHITSPEDPRASLFTAFLRTLSGKTNTSHLFLLGDIFDLWVADHRYFIDRYRPIIDEICRLRKEGVEISYFEGNHDLYLRYYWADKVGIRVCEGPVYVRLRERTLRLEHGDQMDPDDRGYRFLRWFLRTPPIRFLTHHLPSSIIVRIGDRASAGSRHYTSNMKTIAPDVATEKIRAHARRAYAHRPFDIIISGHVHIRDDVQIDDGCASYRSINLGSWLDTPCYFKLDDNEARFFELRDDKLAPSAAQGDTQAVSL